MKELSQYPTLDELVAVFGRLPEDTAINSNEWEQAYEDLINFLYGIGSLTEHTNAIEKIVQMLDKIDTQDGEV